MSNLICPAKLNAYVANEKADAVMATSFADETNDAVSNIHLVKVILRADFFKQPAGKPFYAFVKQYGEIFILVDLQSGNAKAVSGSDIASETDVRGRFVINGIAYDVKDSINGFKRYRPVADTCRRQKKLERSFKKANEF